MNIVFYSSQVGGRNKATNQLAVCICMRKSYVRRILVILLGGIIGLWLHCHLHAITDTFIEKENAQQARWDALENIKGRKRDPMLEDAYQPGLDLLLQVNYAQGEILICR